MKPPTTRTAMLGIAVSAILAAGALAQNPADPSNRRAVEPPRTSGEAPRNVPAPTGHRQPTAKDVPPEVNQAPPNAANRDIDRQLKICRGCQADVPGTEH
jgi:hypothetical protein